MWQFGRIIEDESSDEEEHYGTNCKIYKTPG